MSSDLYIRHRYGVLFFGLLLSLAVAPILDPLGFEMGTIEAPLALNLIAAVLAVALVTRPAAAWLDQG